MSETFAAAIEASKKKSSSNTWIEEDFLDVAGKRTASLSFEMFLKSNFAKHLTEEEAKAAFDRMDLDKNGSIDLTEWSAGLSALECQVNILNSKPESAISMHKSDVVYMSGVSKSYMSSTISSMAGTHATSKHTTIRYKLIDLGTAIAVSDAAGESMSSASASMMTFTAMDFAGKIKYGSSFYLNLIEWLQYFFAAELMTSCFLSRNTSICLT